MKKLMKYLAVALCMVMLAGLVVKPAGAEAASAVTYLVHYSGTEWAWTTDGKTWSSLNAMDFYFAEGDKILVDAESDTVSESCIITVSKKVGEMAATGACTAILNAAAGVTNAYAANGATLVLNANPDNVSVYPGTVVQVNGNVKVFNAYYADGKDTTFAVTGTVDQVNGRISDYSVTVNTAYDLKAGQCVSGDESYIWLEKGTIKTSPSTTSAAAASTTTSSAKELDEVPKTGYGVESSALFFGLAAVIALIGVGVKKTNR